MPVQYQPVNYLIPQPESAYNTDVAARQQHMMLARDQANMAQRQQAMAEQSAQAEAQRRQQVSDYVSQPDYDPSNVEQQKELMGIDYETGLKANQQAQSVQKDQYSQMDSQHKQLVDFAAKIAPMLEGKPEDQQHMILQNAMTSGALSQNPVVQKSLSSGQPLDLNAFQSLAAAGGYVSQAQKLQNKVADHQAMTGIDAGIEQQRHARDRSEKLYDRSQEIPDAVAKQTALMPGNITEAEHKARISALKTGQGKLTEDQSKATGWLIQANNAYDNMKKVMESDKSASKPGLADAIAGNGSGLTGALGNSMRSNNRQKFVQGASSLSESLLRAATGAGITRDEAQQKISELTPQWGDSEDTIAQKFDAIPKYIAGLRSRAGEIGADNADAALGQASTPPPELAAKFTKGKIYESNGSQFLFDGEKMVKQ